MKRFKEREGRVNVLVSRVWLDNAFDRYLKEHRRKLNLLVDCGAFTYWSLKKPTPDVYDYMEWLNGLQCKPDSYFALDVIGNPVKTLENLRIMRKEGFSPIPIFQLGADWQDMSEYAAGADRVAFGGIVGKQAHVQWMYENCPVPKRVHWLGVTNPGMMVRHKPTSVDSSNFQSALRFGQVYLYLGAGRCCSAHISQDGVDAEGAAGYPEPWHRSGGVARSGEVARRGLGGAPRDPGELPDVDGGP